MDIYSTSFTLPRPSGAVAFADDSGTPAAVAAANSPNTLTSPTNFSNGDANRNDAARSTGRMSSMRSRLPPSVKAFMPAAFGGNKRTSDRIVEAVGTGSEKEGGETEGEGDGMDSTIEETSKAASPLPKSSLSNPSTMNVDGRKESTPTGDAFSPDLSSRDQRSLASKNRDSRSTVGTNSSLDLSSTTSVSANSTAASTAPAFGTAGGSIRSPSEPRSATHSASGSLSAFGFLHQIPSTNDLTDSMQRLSVEAMSSHQCLVSFTAAQHPSSSLTTLHANSSSTSLSSDPFHRQSFPSLPGPATLPFPSQYPYQQYAQGFDAYPNGAGGIFSPSSTFSNSRSNGQQSHTSLPTAMKTTSSSMSGSQQNLGKSVVGSSTMRAPQYNFHLSGGYQQVMAARGQILRDHPFKTRLTIKVPRNNLLDILPGSAHQHGGFIPSDYLKPDVRRRLDEIAIGCKCFISLVSNEYYGADLGYGLEMERNVEMIISGQLEGAEHARVRVMVMLDELSGLHSEACEIEYKLHNIVGGRKRCVIQTIQEETGTNIYLPSPFSGVLSSTRVATILTRQNTVYLTGEYFGVQRAREMLFQVSLHKSKNIISRDTAVLPRKIDWMLLEKIEELRTFMMDDATFIHLPMLGSQASMVTVYGDNRVSIERTIRSVMQLACQFYIASLWLLPPQFENVMTPSALNSTQMTPIIKQIANASGAEVVFKGNCFELHGLESEVRHGILQLLDLDVIQPHHFEVRFQIELANEHREFISGKKNGKINKIMKQGVRIKFETFNDYNFLIDISSNDRGGTLQGLNLLLEELPAEVSFHIPENYHKRIIGVGGKNIQRTMKKYGVYVKFYSKQDLDLETYPFLDCEDNVIARTPAKNSPNLENLKVAVMELVNPKDRDFVTETVPIARRYHRTLLGEKGIFIHDIESKLGCLIRFPPPESAVDLVSIFGPESQIHIAAQMLLDHVPFEAEFRTPYSVDLERLLASHEFVALTERVKRDLNINIVLVMNGHQQDVSPTIGSNSQQQQRGGEAVFKLRLNRSNADFLPAAKDALEDFLISRNIDVYETQERQRSDSFASSFPHFANKLISSVSQATESTDSFQTDLAARYHQQQQHLQHHQQQQQQQQQQQAQESNILRAAASTPDIKALFDSPNTSQQGRFFPSAGAVAPVPSMSTTTTSVVNANNSPLINSSMFTTPFPDGPTNATSSLGGGGDVWGAPNFLHHRSTASTASQGGGVGSGIIFPPRSVRLSGDSHSVQRPNEDVAAAMNLEDSVRALRKPRSFSHRTQSLDIGAMAAQQVVQQAIAGHNGMDGMRPTMTGKMSNSSFPSSNNSLHHINSTNNQRVFGAIGSSPNPMTGISNQVGRGGGGGGGGSNDYTNSIGIFAPRLQQQQQQQQMPTQPQHQNHHHQQQHSFSHQQQNQPASSSQYHHHHHHHHIPSPSISRLAPSAIQHAPEPETADEVLRSLAQLHFPSSSS
ncbi:hypothetical protein CBS101457_003648 [Exobasidium rhododendri]|nr:hypothetical protein CBS101457_003648 [Exobasidium rhododendri]